MCRLVAAPTNSGARVGAGADLASFREELHAIEADLAAQGIALCSDVIVTDDLASGALAKPFDLALPGFGYYPVCANNHPRRFVIEVFVRWISSDPAQAGRRRRPINSLVVEG